jgi:NADH dehydrogenase FAD-containing subunit
MGDDGDRRPRVVVVGGGFGARRCVRTDAGDEIGYDDLVLCRGSRPTLRHPRGTEQYASTVYTRGAAVEVRDALLGNPGGRPPGHSRGRRAGDRHRGGRATG